MQNWKKIIAVIGFLILLILLLVLSNVESQGEISVDPDPIDYEDIEDEQIENEVLIEKNTTFDEILKNSTVYSTVIELEKYPWVGNWISKDFFTDYFKNKQGKIKFRTSTMRNLTKQFDFFISDGLYADQMFAHIKFNSAKTIEIYEDKKIITLINGTNIVTLQENFELLKKIKCENSSLQINFEKENTNSKNIQIFFNLTSKNLDLLCNIEFKTELIIDDLFYTKIPKYSIMMSILAVIHSVAALKLIKKVIDNESEGNSFSIITISFISIWDMYLCIFNFLLSIKLDYFFQYLATPSFFYFALFTVFETRLIMMIWKSRYFPSVTSIEIIRNNLFKFYMKFYLFLIIIMIIANKYIFHDIFLFSINLYLIPQIIHTSMRGQHQEINFYYLIGLVCSRTIFILYIRGCPYNLLEIKPNYVLCVLIVIAVLLQIMLIVMQQYYGPRFLIPKRFLTNSYDYFVSIPDLDLEMNISTEFHEDCVICMNALHYEPNISVENDDRSVPPYLKRLKTQKRKIMVTPCKHRYHAACLIDWMNIKMECPTCRKPLPPI